MAVVLHVIDASAVVGAVVGDDIAALNGVDDIAHVAVSINDGGGVSATLAGVATVRRKLRELSIRHDIVAVHAHGSQAWRVSAFCADTYIVDDGDERPEHRLLPSPRRRVFACHADLDRGLDRGVPQRQAALAPPGVDAGNVVDVDVDDIAVVVAPGVTVAHVDTVIARAGVNLAVAPGALARYVVGAHTPLSPAIVSAIASGVPLFSFGAPWRDEFEGFKAIVDVTDLDELVAAIAAARLQRRRKVPKSLGRATRTAELSDIYASVVGPARLQARFRR